MEMILFSRKASFVLCFNSQLLLHTHRTTGEKTKSAVHPSMLQEVIDESV